MQTRVAWLALVLGVAGCRSCTDAAPTNILALVEPDAVGVVHVGDLTKMSESLEAYTTRLTRKTGPALKTSFKQKLEAEVGLNPLDPGAWKNAGIDPLAGLLMFTEGNHRDALVAVGVSDRKRFDAALAAVVEKADGANRVEKSQVEGVELHSMGRPFGDQTIPVVHWWHHGGFAIVARGESLDVLKAAAARLGKQPLDAPTLASSTEYAALVKRVPPMGAAPGTGGAVATVRLKGRVGEMVQPELAAIPADSLSSVRIGAEGLSVDSFLALDLPGLEGILGKEPSLPLASQVDEGAVAVVLSHAARGGAVEVLKRVEALRPVLQVTLGEVQRRTGLDPEADVLPHVSGPLTISVHLHQLETLPQQLQRRNLAALFDVVQIAAVAKLTDPQGMRAALSKSQAELQKNGVAIRTRTIQVDKEPVHIFEPDVPTPRLGWGVVGDRYFYGVGTGRAEAIVKSFGRSSPLPQTLESTAAGALGKEEGSTLLVLRMGQIADAAMEAKVGGPFTQLAGSVAELAKAVGDLALSVRGVEGGFELKLRQIIQ